MMTRPDAVDRDAVMLRREFQSMPALVLTASQTARLLDVRLDHATAILVKFEEEGWLMHSATGAYRRAEPALA